jgi:hypothetical protein
MLAQKHPLPFVLMIKTIDVGFNYSSKIMYYIYIIVQSISYYWNGYFLKIL